MKKYLKLIVLIILVFPIIINAKTVSYNDAVKKANNYIYNFNKYEDYIYFPSSRSKIDYFTSGGFLTK